MAKRGTIDDFKANVAGDFARPNLFQVDLNFPQGVINNAALIELGKFTVRAANLPSSQIGVIEVPFRGRTLKIAGDRTFEPWTVTIQNDSGFVLRSAFELWASSIQAYNENFTSAGGLGDADDATGYFADMTVHQLARDVKDGESPKILKSYKFYNVFPSNIAAIDLDFGNNDAIEEFTVELQTQYWTPIQAND
ncbi:tail tube monomer [Synechococcus phage S-RIM2]|uniref:Tail tube monomer n=1 Tax=Synechococcus phage S-RIM2 TaxID=687800 RepID=A0A1D7S4P5_9CAUD|nr:tail tube monomer [Synechococcus phage S-RIM2]AON98707.1 tail tube monomer [Synechococcus phage S-RIM2]AON99350.1 tail tube monomer [Synechococcus phage S-RIM2]AOO07693.1 tail tube monomer [Synechococcus phage S-RIM2]AOO08124.1 tail tube monomer [Synechococcus phage S-RIM2]